MSNEMKKRNLLLHYAKMLLCVILALLVRAAAFAPLAFLATDTLKPLALLCPVLLVFVVLPLRFSFAEAAAQKNFDIGLAFSFGRYGEKLSESALHALNVIKWGIPLAAMLVYAAYWYSEVDALTVLKTITAVGEWWTGMIAAVANFFGAQVVAPAAAMMDGVFVLLGVLGLGVVIWMYGAVRNSATRYIWVLASRNDRPTRVEVRRRLRGRRLAQLGVALINLVLWSPFLGAVSYRLMNAFGDLTSQLAAVMMTGKMPQLDLMTIVLPLVLAFVLLYLPLLPVRRWLTAAFALRERKASVSA